MSDNIRQKVATGARWSGISGAVNAILQLLTVMVLARFVAPEEFGVMAIVLVVQGLGGVFSRMGLSAAVIQAQRLTNAARHTLFWLNAVLGFAVFACIIAVSPFLANLLDMPELVWALPVTSTSFLASAFAIQYRSLAQKELMFGRWAAIEITAATFAALLSIVMAWQGYGLWALVGGFLTGSVLSSICWFILGVRHFGRPEMLFDWPSAQRHVKFGAYRLGAMLANAASSRVDQFVVGYLLGAESLGYYSLTIRLVLRPIERINPLIARVAFPAFAKIQQNRGLLGQWFVRLIRLLALINTPILVCLAMVAHWFVPVVLGDTWTPIIPLVQILSFYALFRSMMGTGGSVLLAIGRADYTFYWNVCLLLMIPAVVVVSALYGGLQAIAWGLLLTQLVVMLVYQLFVMAPVVRQPRFNIIAALSSPLAASLLAGGLAISLVLRIGFDNDLLSLVVTVLTTAAVYSCLVFVAFRNEANFVIGILRGRA
jgi:PST family polysaccharide transporter/teichuronic acid exporter/lipopolysaccharide exporter